VTDSSFAWATVTQLSPLRTRFDGDAAALPLTPESLVDPLGLIVGSRVRCELFDRRVLIVGVSGGGPLPALVVADVAALPAAAGYREGARLHVDALNVDFLQKDGVWVQDGIATVTSVANRNTEYAKASAAYRVNGAQVRVTGLGIVYEYMTTALSPVGVDAWYPVTGVFPALQRRISANATSDGTNRTVAWDAAGAFARNIVSGTDGTIELAAGTFTIRQPGRWKISSQVTWITGSTFTHHDLYKNGAMVERRQAVMSAASYSSNTLIYEDVFAAGNTFRTDHNAGASVQIVKTDGADNTSIVVEYMGPG
jgi:hypothetical protein